MWTWELGDGCGSRNISVGSNRFTGDWNKNICFTVGKSWTTFQTLRMTKNLGIAPEWKCLPWHHLCPEGIKLLFVSPGHVTVGLPYLPLQASKPRCWTLQAWFLGKVPISLLPLLSEATNRFSNHVPDPKMSFSSLWGSNLQLGSHQPNVFLWALLSFVAGACFSFSN